MENSLQNSPFSTEPVSPISFDRSLAEPLVTEGVFSPEECEATIKLADGQWMVSTVNTSMDDSAPEVFYDVRNSTHVILEHTDETDWLFQKVLALVLAANHQFYHFEINYIDAIQVTAYGEGDFYDWHVDIGPERMGNRKLSVTVQLSAEEDYDGGELIIDFDTPNFRAPRKLGSATVFPSFLKHQVDTVTKGERYSLVAWISGTHRFK